MIATEIKINPQMITLARESRGYSQREVADFLSISPGKLCRVEQDDQGLTEEILDKMSEFLGYPRSFFFQAGEGYMPNSLAFRKRVNVAQKLLMPIEAQINIYRLGLVKVVDAMKGMPTRLPELHVNEFGSPQEVARHLRKLWKLPKGAIENITLLVESKKILVLSFDFGTERVDSRPLFVQNKLAAIVLNKSLLGDRLRFSIAYELGHLIMHSHSPAALKNRDIAHEANQFAAEFLMPSADILHDFESDITINRLAELKLKWKTSMQSLLYRAEDLGCLTYNQKRYLIGQFNSLKIRRREPPEFDIPVEVPVLLKKLVLQYKEKSGLTIKDLAREFHLTETEFVQKYL